MKTSHENIFPPMKTIFLSVVFLTAIFLAAPLVPAQAAALDSAEALTETDLTALLAQAPPDGKFPYVETERGPNHSVFQRLVLETNSIGKILLVTNSYTELETGKHFWRGGQSLASQAKIELLADGAAATNGPHHAYFAADLNSSNFRRHRSRRPILLHQSRHRAEHCDPGVFAATVIVRTDGRFQPAASNQRILRCARARQDGPDA